VLDATFGTGGVRHVPIASALGAIAVTPSSSDTFTIAAAGADDYGIYALARFGNAGALVAAFGDAGVVSGLPNVYASRAVLGLADGKLLAGATAILPSDGGYAWRVSLERLDDTGARDPSFGVGGQALVSMDPTPDAPLVADIARQSDGRILVAAKARGGMCVARLWP
jgi:hypothetical protein